MNKAELIAAMMKVSGLSKKNCEIALEAFTCVVKKELQKDGKVKLVGFRTFEVKSRAARTGCKPGDHGSYRDSGSESTCIQGRQSAKRHSLAITVPGNQFLMREGKIKTQPIPYLL